MPGDYEGKLIIEDDSKVYAYKVVINVRDVVEQEIHIKTIERKAFKGEIANIPEGNYEVTSSTNFLKFDKIFVSNNQNKGIFKFEHYSTKPGESECYLIFKGDKVGQLTYLLKINV